MSQEHGVRTNGVRNSVKNCAGCGLIFSQASWEACDQCPFCQRPTSSKKDRRRRLEEGEDEAGLLVAVELKNRLVAADREAAARARLGMAGVPRAATDGAQ